MSSQFTKGYTHIYTGDGKGKTSAALGLVFRAAGSGIRSIVIQFMKGLPTGEQESSRMLGGLVTIEQYGSDRFCKPNDGLLEEHRDFARRGYERARRALESEECPILVLDEIITAVKFGLLSNDDVIALIKNKPGDIELVLTGRGADKSLIKHADIVTEMREIKHYYKRGVAPRKGIED
jgi:cob(I)alamin adenosyltransferase